MADEPPFGARGNRDAAVIQPGTGLQSSRRSPHLVGSGGPAWWVVLAGGAIGWLAGLGVCALVGLV